MNTLMEKIASKKNKKRNKKYKGPKDLYAPDMSEGAPGAKTNPKGKFEPTNPKPEQPKLESKKSFGSNNSFTSSKGPEAKKVEQLAQKARMFTPKRIALGALGTAALGGGAYALYKNRNKD